MIVKLSLVALFSVLALLVFIAYKAAPSHAKKNKSAFIDHLKENGKGAAFGIFVVTVAALVVIAAMFFSVRASASSIDYDAEIKYFYFTEFKFGIDNTFETSPQCRQTGLGNDKLTSNVRATQNIFYASKHDWRAEINGSYQHHSCAINDDRNTYDSLGIELNIRKYWF